MCTSNWTIVVIIATLILTVVVVVAVLALLCESRVGLMAQLVASDL